MATLLLATETESSMLLAHERVMTLRDWLQGQWGLVFSHPADFAPHSSTPPGFTTCIADDLLAAGIKPLVFSTSLEQLPESWFDHALNDDSVVLLANHDARVLDLAECALASQLAALNRPFVLILDDRGRCRTTLTYAPNAQHRPRTMLDIIEIVATLRSGTTHQAPALRAQLA